MILLLGFFLLFVLWHFTVCQRWSPRCSGLQSLLFLFVQRPSCLWSAPCVQWGLQSSRRMESGCRGQSWAPHCRYHNQRSLQCLGTTLTSLPIASVERCDHHVSWPEPALLDLMWLKWDYWIISQGWRCVLYSCWVGGQRFGFLSVDEAVKSAWLVTWWYSCWVGVCQGKFAYMKASLG